MPAFSVSRSIEIHAPQQKVFDTLRDFKTWPTWSPWIITEPETKLTYSEDGKSYSWDGKYVGLGTLAISSDSSPDSMDCDLSFLKPFKSTANTRFRLTPTGNDTTKVTWEMDSSLPFFLFFMTKMFSALVGLDYQRGLNMLKNYIEDGEVPSKLTFDTIDSPQLNLVGIKTESSFADMGQTMDQCMEKLSCIEGIGKGISIYHKWDVVNEIAKFTVGYLVDSLPDKLPENCVAVTVPTTPAYTITHTGPYHHLGNGWNAGISRARNKAFKKNNRIHPFEIYENRPDEVDEKDLITVIHFPMKS